MAGQGRQILLMMRKWFITNPKSGRTLTATLGYISHNNAKKDLFGEKF